MKKIMAMMVTVVMILSMSVQVFAGPSYECNDRRRSNDDDIIYYDDDYDDCDYYNDSYDDNDDNDSYDEEDDDDYIIYYDDDCDNDEEEDTIIYFNDCECSYMTVTSSANVRSGPGTCYCIVGSVSEGDVVAVVGEGYGCDGIHWYKTKCGNYIYSGAFEKKCSCDKESSETTSSTSSNYYNAVVVCIANQTVQLYKHGEVVCESSCVTGTEGVYDTPRGEFEICDKAENRTLTGKDYSVTVKYWMEFSDGCGLHDGDNWRENYGGDIYQENGSHGCVNMPEWMAETIYKSCPEGTPVIVY